MKTEPWWKIVYSIFNFSTSSKIQLIYVIIMTDFFKKNVSAFYSGKLCVFNVWDKRMIWICNCNSQSYLQSLQTHPPDRSITERTFSVVTKWRDRDLCIQKLRMLEFSNLMYQVRKNMAGHLIRHEEKANHVRALCSGKSLEWNCHLKAIQKDQHQEKIAPDSLHRQHILKRIPALPDFLNLLHMWNNGPFLKIMEQVVP